MGCRSLSHPYTNAAEIPQKSFGRISREQRFHGVIQIELINHDRSETKRKAMKHSIQISQSCRRALALALLVAVVGFVGHPTSASAADGTAKGGAAGLIKLKTVKTVEDLQGIEVGDTIVMSCPKCKESYAQVVEKSFKGSTGDQLKTVQIHLCDGCTTKIVTKGHGKAAKDVVVHTCKSCGSKDVNCCVMKKGAGPTPGMDK